MARFMSGVVGIVSCFALSGCAHPTQSSVVDANGFSQTSYGVMALATGGQFVGADWRVDDWVAKGSSWEPKGGAEYETVRDLDLNGDGQIGSDEHLRERVSDLKLSNLRDGSVIWLKVHPMLPSAARMDLSSLLDKFGEGLAGAKPLAQASLFTSAPPAGRVYTAFLVERKLAAVAGFPAISGDYEMADTARLAADPKQRLIRSRVVLAKIGHLQRYKSHNPPTFPWPATAVPGQSLSYLVHRTALVVIGYAARAEKFDEHRDEFQAFVDKVRFAPFVYIPEDPESVAESVEPIPAPTPAPPPQPPVTPPEPSSSPETLDGGAPPTDPAPDAGVAAPSDG